MPTTTTTYSFNKPVVGADEDDWGGYLNGNWDSVDDLLDGTTPVTGIDINSGTLDGVTIGGTTAGAGTFTTLTANTSITGTLATAAQTNITSVGTLTSLDVGGTITSDGLTVDGTASVSGTTTLADGTNGEMLLGLGTALITGAGTYDSAIRTNGGGSLLMSTGTTKRLSINTIGDISFYEDTGTTAKFFWDASAESLGIGTSSPDTALNIGFSGADQVNSLRIEGSNGSSERYALDIEADGANAKTNFKIGTGGGAPTTRMTIDNSGNVGIGTTSPSSFNGGANNLVVGSGSGSEGMTIYADSASNSAIFFADGTSGATTYTGQINYLHASDAMSFHTNGGSERMRIDSNGNVGMGVSSIVNPGGSRRGLQLSNSTNGGILFLNNNASEDQNPRVFGDITNTTDLGFAAGGTNGTINYYTNNIERMRIDSSGNLLVGTTDNTPYNNSAGSTADNGIALGATGIFSSAKYNDATINLNRTGSDGDIAVFRKNGATVGSIGSYSGVGMYAMAPNNGGSGLLFYDNAAPIYPIKNVSGSATIGDAYTDLGAAVHRFKDLYLSGGVYLGGTGAANKLDDYESGTFTPQVTVGGTGVSSSTAYGSYVKVGDLVYFTLTLQDVQKGAATGAVQIAGLPFTVASATSGNPNSLLRWDDITSAGTIIPHTRVSTTNVELQSFGSSGYTGNTQDTAMSSTCQIYGCTGVYKVA